MQLVIQKNGDRKYVSIKESFWDAARKKYSSRTVENFGRLDILEKDNPNILAELRQRVESFNENKETEKQKLILARVEKATQKIEVVQDANADNRTLMIGAVPYRQLWNKLSLTRKLRDFQKESKAKYDLAEAIFYMVAARSLMPDSKLGQWEKRNTFLYGGPQLKLCHLYRSLDLLVKNKDNLVTYLNRQIARHYKRTVNVALYDVTTYWFESQDADTLRNFGFSKDNKVNQVQVVMGLLIDQNGIPIDYELFPGNTNEFGTMIPILKRLKEQYDLERVIVTADRGLNSGRNLKQILDLGLEYVIAYRLRNSGEKIRALIADENGWTYRRSSNISDVSKYRITGESRPVRWVDENTGEIHNETLESNLLVNYSAKRAMKDAHDRQRLIDKAKRYEDNPSMLKSDLRRGGKSYLKIDADGLSAEVDEARIRKNAFFDGYYGISYSDSEMSPEEVLAVHHSLWQIEESFRISKSLFEARPCFHWKESRIRGHFLICYLALVLHRLLERTLADAGEVITAERIVTALAEAELIEVMMSDGQATYAKVRTEGDFERICKAVGLECLPRLAKAATVKRALKLKEL